MLKKVTPPAETVEEFVAEFEEEEMENEEEESVEVDSEEESEASDVTSHEVNTTEKPNDDVVLVPLDFEAVTVNSWVLVVYEGEKFLGRCLGKAGGKFRVQCLSLPFGVRLAQDLEKEADAVYYDEVYKAPIIPWGY